MNLDIPIRRNQPLTCFRSGERTFTHIEMGFCNPGIDEHSTVITQVTDDVSDSDRLLSLKMYFLSLCKSPYTALPLFVKDQSLYFMNVIDGSIDNFLQELDAKWKKQNQKWFPFVKTFLYSAFRDIGLGFLRLHDQKLVFAGHRFDICHARNKFLLLNAENVDDFQSGEGADIRFFLQLFYSCIFYPLDMSQTAHRSLISVPFVSLKISEELGLDKEILNFLNQASDRALFAYSPSYLYFANSIFYDVKDKRHFVNRLGSEFLKDHLDNTFPKLDRQFKKNKLDWRSKVQDIDVKKVVQFNHRKEFRKTYRGDEIDFESLFEQYMLKNRFERLFTDLSSVHYSAEKHITRRTTVPYRRYRNETEVFKLVEAEVVGGVSVLECSLWDSWAHESNFRATDLESLHVTQ